MPAKAKITADISPDTATATDATSNFAIQVLFRISRVLAMAPNF
ncbi:hypothetical protein [Alteromonas flava]|nr:hypothetical protein [Alteromonas flava]